jgi:DNA invertase Pin-like site-specific DNA recombinase
LHAQARRRNLDIPAVILILLDSELRKQANLKGLRSAMKNGIRFGRPPSLNPKQIARVKTLRRQGKTTRALGVRFGVSSATISRVSQ